MKNRNERRREINRAITKLKTPGNWMLVSVGYSLLEIHKEELSKWQEKYGTDLRVVIVI